jgi:hypothetical protein
MLTPCEWCSPLRRNFSRFPSGWAGVALLLLRGIVGAITITEAAVLLAGAHSPFLLLAAACAAVGGVALVLGILTPVVSALLTAEAVMLILTFPTPGLQWLDSRPRSTRACSGCVRSRSATNRIGVTPEGYSNGLPRVSRLA